MLLSLTVSFIPRLQSIFTAICGASHFLISPIPTMSRILILASCAVPASRQAASGFKLEQGTTTGLHKCVRDLASNDVTYQIHPSLHRLSLYVVMFAGLKACMSKCRVSACLSHIFTLFLTSNLKRVP